MTRAAVPARAPAERGGGPGTGRAAATAVAAGLAVGSATSGAQTVLGGSAVAGLANAVSPWMVAPFLLGAWARSRRAAAGLGVFTGVAQVAGHSWRTATGRERGAGAALLVAAWACEAVITFGVVLGHPDDAVVFGAVAVLLFVLLGRHRRQHAALAAWLLPGLALGVLGTLALHALL